MSNITQVVNADKNMRTLKKGVHYSDLDQLLSSTGPFTFFAPSDLAFEKQGNTFMDDMLTASNKPKLTDLLTGHIVSGKIDFLDLKDGDKLQTLSGSELVVEVRNGAVFIGGAAIVPRPQRISNGVVHSTDTVFVK